MGVTQDISPACALKNALGSINVHIGAVLASSGFIPPMPGALVK